MCINSMSVCSIVLDRDTVGGDEDKLAGAREEGAHPNSSSKETIWSKSSSILPKCLWVNGEGAGGTQNVAHVKTFKATIDRPSPPNLKPTPSLCLLDAAAIAHRGRRDPAAVATACAKKLRKK